MKTVPTPARLNTLKALMAACLVAAASHAAAGDFLVVIPVKGRATVYDNISVTLNSYTLPSGQVGASYAGFDFNNLLTVTGDSSYTGTGVAWAIKSGSLPAGLALGADGRLTGTPSASGNASFTVGATYRTKEGSQMYSLSIAPGTPVAALSLTNYAFPSVLQGSTQPSAFKPITLSNTGTAPLNISSVSFTGANASKFAIANNPCGSSLPAKSSCTIDIQATNWSSGSYSATLSIVTAELGTKTVTVSSATDPFYMHQNLSPGGATNGLVVVQTNGVQWGPAVTSLNPITSIALVNGSGTTWTSSSIGGDYNTMSNYIWYTWRTATFAVMPPSGYYTLKALNSTGDVIGQQTVIVP